jgi:hypothetical protein
MDVMNGINPFVARSETKILSFGNAGKTLPYCRKKINFPLATNKAFRSKNSPFRNFSYLRYFDRRVNYFYSYSAAANKEFLSTHSFAPGTSNLQNKYLLCGRRSLTSRAFALWQDGATQATGRYLHLFLESSASSFAKLKLENCSMPCSPTLTAPSPDLSGSRSAASASGHDVQLFFIALTTQQMRRCRDRGPEGVPCTYSFSSGRRRPRTRWRVLPR